MLKTILKNAARQAMKVAQRPLAPPTPGDQQLIDELRATFSQLPVHDTANRPRSEADWLESANLLRERILRDDPRGFLRWDMIARTMTVEFSPYIWRELQFLKGLADWRRRWYPAIKESAAGSPIPYPLHPRSSGTLIHHAYHLAQFENKTGRRIHEFERVLEFGGGYGGMRRLFSNLGFENEYIIYDLPSSTALQRYYLQSLGIDCSRCVSDLEQLRELLTRAPSRSRSLLIATWSMSEAPISAREPVLSLASDFDSFLIAYQDWGGEVDNVNFFADWAHLLPQVKWHQWEIEYIPKNFYLMGAVR